MAERLKHNSPDETQYHESSDIPGTMLPRAAKDGQSMAFDPNKPQTVIVDPGETGGGFTVDMSSFSKVRSQFNKLASRKESMEDPSAFFREAAKLAFIEDKPKPAKEVVVSTPDYKAIQPIKPLNSDASPLHQDKPKPAELSSTVNALIEEERQKAAAADAMKQAVSEQASLPSSMQPGYVPGPDPHILALLDRQAETLNQVINVVNTLSTAQQEERSFAKEAEEAVQSSPPSEHFEDKQAEQYETKIPFIDAGKPGRPKYETYFEMSKMGTMAARYHAVVEGKDCLALVYDTRFEDGFQYLPPNLGEERITVTVPEMGNKAYTCSSLGLNWSLGCLDVVILIKHGDGEE